MAALPPPCADEERFLAGVAARLGRDPFDDDAEDEIRIRARDEEDRLVLIVEAVHRGEVLGARELQGTPAACDELLANAELSVSVLLDPLTTVFPTEEASPDETSSTATAAPAASPSAEADAGAPPAVVVEEPVAPSVSPRVRGAAFVSLGRQPGVGLGARAGVQARSPAALLLVDGVSLGIEVGGTLPAFVQAGGGEVHGAEAAVSLVPCGHLWLTEVCGIIDAGALFASGSSFASPAAGVLPLFAVGARAGIALPLFAGLMAEAHGTLTMPLTRHRLRAKGSGDVLWETAPVAGSIGVGLAWDLGTP